MSYIPDYQDGTVSLTTGTKDLVGVGTAWASGSGIQTGDMFMVGGFVALIETVVDDTHITLRDNWGGPTLLAGSTYSIKFSPDQSRVQASVVALINRLSNGNIDALAQLMLEADKLIYADTPSSLALAALTAYARGLLAAEDAAQMLTALGATAIGQAILAAEDVDAAQDVLGGKAVGKAVFASETADAAQTALGATAAGKTLFTAADVQAARAALQVTGFGADPNLGLLTNPFFDISQENGTAAVASGYPVDQFSIAKNAATLVISGQQVLTPFSGASGFRRLSHGARLTISTPQASFGAAESLSGVVQPIEGQFWKTLGWGTADARPANLVAIVSASVAGTYPLAVRNGNATRSYVTTVTLPANTPTVIFKAIPGDTAGAWAMDNNKAADVSIGAVAGANGQAASLDAWLNSGAASHASATNWAATAGAILTVSYLNVFPSGVLPFTGAGQISDENLQLLLNMRRPYDDELRRCQRYFWSGRALQLRGFVLSGFGPAAMGMTPIAQFRTAPTLTVASPISILDGNGGSGNITGISLNTSTVDGISFNPVTSGGNGFSVANVPVIVSLASTGMLAASARM